MCVDESETLSFHSEVLNSQTLDLRGKAKSLIFLSLKCFSEAEAKKKSGLKPENDLS